MTSPVTFDFKKHDSNLITEESNLNMSMRFYIGKEHQENTPKPTGDVFLVEDPEMVAAVIKFGGYASMNDYLNYRNVLIQKLGEESKKYDCVNMMAAGYDPVRKLLFRPFLFSLKVEFKLNFFVKPFKPIGRTNEVWLKKIA